MSNTLKEKVEQRLQDKQKSKEFKDLGRVSNSRKEQAAYKIISSQNLADLETDGVMAFNLVEKDRVWTYEIDPETEKANGVSSGAAFMKTKLKEAVGKRPGDKVIQRRIYVAYLEELQVKLEAAKTVEDILNLRTYFLDYGWGSDMKPDIYFADKFCIELNNIEFNRPNLIKHEYEYCFGKRFLNLFNLKVDTAKEVWYEAKLKESFSAEQEAAIIEKARVKQQENVKRLFEYKKAADNMTDAELVVFTRTKLSNYKPSIPISEYRKAYVKWFEGAESDLVKPVNLKPEQKQREEDWSWAGIKKTRTPSVSGESTGIEINTKPPLDHIIRTGGLRIGIVSPEAVASLFGFGAVNFGNYVKDNEAKEHLKHFLGAMADLGEILNFDLAAMNRLGNLKIGFGLKGKGKALATYYSQTKDINLTKKRGDGSVAHEWGHYLDNMLGEYALMRGTSVFATESRAENPRVNAAVQRIMSYIKTGGDGDIKMTFKAIKSDNENYLKVPYVYQYIGSKRTYRDAFYVSRVSDFEGESGSNLNATINYWVKKIARFSGESNYTINNLFDVLKKVFGQIAFMFDLPEIEVTTKLNMTRFYYNSSQVGSKYWIENVELFARAWESYVKQKLVTAGRKNNYLVNIPNYETMPYPEGAELTRIVELFDELVDLVKREHSIGDFVPFTDEREDYFEGGAFVATTGQETSVEKVIEATPSVVEPQTVVLVSKASNEDIDSIYNNLPTEALQNKVTRSDISYWLDWAIENEDVDKYKMEDFISSSDRYSTSYINGIKPLSIMLVKLALKIKAQNSTPSVIYEPIYQWGDMVRVTNWKSPVKVEEFNVTKDKTYFLGRYNGTRYNMSVANIEGFSEMPLRYFIEALELELVA